MHTYKTAAHACTKKKKMRSHACRIYMNNDRHDFADMPTRLYLFRYVSKYVCMYVCTYVHICGHVHKDGPQLAGAGAYCRHWCNDPATRPPPGFLACQQSASHIHQHANMHLSGQGPVLNS